MQKLNAKQLRVTKPSEEDLKMVQHNPIYIILDNVLDTYNIGAIFRIAEGTAVRELILCAGSETPPSTRIHKAAVGTEEWVPWKYFSSAIEAIDDLRSRVPGIKIVAVEQDKRSISIFNFKFSILPVGRQVFNQPLRGQIQKLKYQNECPPVAIIVGHETDGVSKEALDASDLIVEMPMYGVNISLNVMVSTGIALYKVLEEMEKCKAAHT